MMRAATPACRSAWRAGMRRGYGCGDEIRLAIACRAGSSRRPRTPSSAARRPRPTAIGRSVVTIVGSRGNFCTGSADRADAGADGGALRAARRGLQDRGVWRRQEAAIAGREDASRSIPASRCRRCWRIAPPPMSRCCSSQLRPRARRRRRSACRSCRLPSARQFTIAGIGVTVRGDGKSGGTIRAAALVATGKPGTLQIRLVDPAGQGTREGLGACTGDSGAPVFEDQQAAPRSSASSAGRPGRTAAPAAAA